MAAELQLVSPVFDLSKLAWSAGLFLKYASKADYTAIEVLERVERLRHVTEGVNLVLQSRHKADVPLADKEESFIGAKIQESLTACIEFLQDLEQRVEGFDVSDVPVKVLVTRFKVAWRHKSMSQGQSDLEARISILQINLIILQLANETVISVLTSVRPNSTIGANHSELFELIAELDKQVLHGNGLLKLILGRFGQHSTAIPAAPLTDVTLMPDLQAETGAVSSLRDCLHAAEDIRERYTSDYVPEDRLSQAIATSRPLSPCSRVDMAESESATPIPKTVSATLSQSSMPVDPVSHIETRVLLLRTLDRYIADHRERARAETERSHFKQAETCLESAARYSEAREHQYGIPFAEKIEIGEELANIYQRQGRWAEAVSKLHELMREDGQDIDDAAVLANARHNQLLASVYFDRHMHSTPNTPHTGSDDLEVAEKHAHVAFAKLDSVIERGEGALSLVEETGRHYKCMQLIVSILDARGKLVEANVWREMLVEGSASGRPSTSTPRTLPVEPAKDRHEAFALAIKSSDGDQLHSQTAFQDLNLEKVLGRGEGKTLLMHAVEYSDESVVEKLLDPAVGATVDMRDRKGQTSLHLAAALGRHNMVRCLLHHDADIEAKDNDGETPIVKAVKGGHRDIVQDLLDRGANATTKNLVRLNEFG
ncbi:E3 ubiquitin-protein ligase mib2 [Elasticomyces elasticus]|nr:E3 ubiquitin-protein ligase mib2 [Elasticomyces elasticus]